MIKLGLIFAFGIAIGVVVGLRQSKQGQRSLDQGTRVNVKAVQQYWN